MGGAERLEPHPLFSLPIVPRAFYFPSPQPPYDTTRTPRWKVMLSD